MEITLCNMTLSPKFDLYFENAAKIASLSVLGYGANRGKHRIEGCGKIKH